MGDSSDNSRVCSTASHTDFSKPVGQKMKGLLHRKIQSFRACFHPRSEWKAQTTPPRNVDLGESFQPCSNIFLVKASHSGNYHCIYLKFEIESNILLCHLLKIVQITACLGFKSYFLASVLIWNIFSLQCLVHHIWFDPRAKLEFQKQKRERKTCLLL